MTVLIHSRRDYEAAVEASGILFGEGTTADLRRLSEKDFLAVFEGVPQAEIQKSLLETGIPVIELVVDKANLFASRSEAKRLIQQGGLSINKEKISDSNATVTGERLLNGRYLLLQKGKKSYFMVKAV